MIEVAVWQCEWWWRSGLEGGRALKPAGRFSEPGVRALESTESAMGPAERALVYVGSQSWLGGP